MIGPAGDQDYPTGNYYGTPARKVGVVQGLREVLGAGVTIDYEKGADVVGPADADGGGPRGGAGQAVGRRGPLSRHEPAGRSRGPRPPRPEPARRAAAAARSRVRGEPEGRARAVQRRPARGHLGARSAAGDPRGVVSRARRAASPWRARCSASTTRAASCPTRSTPTSMACRRRTSTTSRRATPTSTSRACRSIRSATA